jgi:hypothetical protein
MSEGLSPFSELSPFERSGALKDIYEATKGGKDYIVKKYAFPSESGKREVKLGSFSYEISSPKWLRDEPPVGSFEFSAKRKNDYQKLKKYYGEMLAETLFVYGEDEEGNRSNFEVQEKIQGKSLANLSAQEMTENTTLQRQVREFARISLEMFQKTGWLPDIHEDVFATDNLILDENNNLKFIDTDSIYKVPPALFQAFKTNLFDDSGINPELLLRLRRSGQDERYLGDINLTLGSLLEAANLEIEEEAA